jgi:hypothetical protein
MWGFTREEAKQIAAWVRRYVRGTRRHGAKVLSLKLVDGVPLTLADGHCPRVRRKTGRVMAIARMGGACHRAMAITP